MNCPKCDSPRFYFRQEYTSFAYVDAIHKGGNIDVGETKDDIPHPMGTLICEDCGWEGGGKQYNEVKNDVSNLQERTPIGGPDKD